MGFAPQFAGPHDPVPSTPPRTPGSIRRTSSIDTTRPGGLDAPLALVDARGRDLLTGDDGGPIELEAIEIRIEVEQPAAVIARIECRPTGDQGVAALVGRRIGGGFRDAAVAATPDHSGAASLRYLLLDDLPGANLVSGFALQHADTVAGTERMSEGARAYPDRILAQADICAGWGDDAVMLTTFRETGVLMTPLGPAAPALDDPDDRSAWHDMAVLPPHGMRRRRRIDVGPTAADGTSAFETHFRDSHVDADGVETVVHEYVVRGRVEDARGSVVEVESEARVLPWFECPGALASAHRIVGVPLAELRRTIRTEFTGLSTCTHLNDTLRSLADLAPLVSRRDRVRAGG